MIDAPSLIVVRRGKMMEAPCRAASNALSGSETTDYAASLVYLGINGRAQLWRDRLQLSLDLFLVCIQRLAHDLGHVGPAALP